MEVEKSEKHVDKINIEIIDKGGDEKIDSQMCCWGSIFVL